ncbi:gb [Venturia nashicola]|uniref:Rhomboid-type serine protease n=1 Tax=Venturia nashicola TaxID=86259 RepID=A0A4Z1P8Q0_9PEZI|nr:gb [Venturia nashicola]TLD28083.1 gb [Venturia nashicola]
MASHDYFSQLDPRHNHTQHRGRVEAPLPPVPSSPSFRPFKPTSNPSNTSPASSPFDDRAYPSYPQASLPNLSQQHLTDPESPRHYGRPGNNATTYSNNDPFTDGNAIPLQNQSKPSVTKTGGVGVTSSPTQAKMGYGHDQRAANHRPSSRSRGRKKRQGLFTGRATWAVFVLTGVQLIMFIVEIVINAQLTGSPIEIKPSFNPMIGPSPYVLINIGARYVPCMREINVTLSDGTVETAANVKLQCPSTTTNDADCSLAQLCGTGMNLDKQTDGTTAKPNQWWRFIVPIFLHGGIIHFGFNMLLQWTLGRDIERQIGTLRFLLVYFASGIFGFVMGGNFAPNGLPSTGCSGSLFGIIALVLLDLLYTWKSRTSPIRDLCFILLDIIISFILGLLPALDNFSHIGGFLMGLVLGICILHSPDSLRERTGQDDPPYATMSGARRDTSSPSASPMGRSPPLGYKLEHSETQQTGLQNFAKQPVGFFKGRKPLWWVWWLFRAAALFGVLIAFILLLRNFYIFETKCSWCKYLSCVPVKNWCDIGNFDVSKKRSIKIAVDALSF